MRSVTRGDATRTFDSKVIERFNLHVGVGFVVDVFKSEKAAVFTQDKVALAPVLYVFPCNITST